MITRRPVKYAYGKVGKQRIKYAVYLRLNCLRAADRDPTDKNARALDLSQVE